MKFSSLTPFHPRAGRRRRRRHSKFIYRPTRMKGERGANERSKQVSIRLEDEGVGGRIIYKSDGERQETLLQQASEGIVAFPRCNAVGRYNFSAAASQSQSGATFILPSFHSESRIGSRLKYTPDSTSYQLVLLLHVSCFADPYNKTLSTC